MRHLVTLLASLLLLAGSGCALPTDAAETVALEEGDGEARVFDLEEVQIHPVSEEFSFVLDADGPQVILGYVWGDAMAVGEPTFVRPPWLTDELAVRRDVNVDAIPVELLVRQGEPFVAPSEDGGTCVGYLGELSVVRLVQSYNLGDLAEDISSEAYDEIYDDERIGPPVSPELNDPAVIWEAAERRTFLTARWETDDECEIGDWGAHPEHAPALFAPIDEAPFVAEAQRQLRARPEYPQIQAEYDEFRQEMAEYDWMDTWAAGPWDAGHFMARAFEAPDGRRIVLGWAEQTDGECGGAPGYLHLLFDVTDDGELVLRDKLGGLPTFSVMRGLLEGPDGELMLLTHNHLERVFEREILHDISPVQIGCGC